MSKDRKRGAREGCLRLVLALATSAGGWGLCALANNYWRPAEKWLLDDENASVRDETAREIYERYGITVDFSPVNTEDQQIGVSGRQLPVLEQREEAKNLARELGKYPPDLIKELGIKKIRSLEALALDGDEFVGGLAAHEVLYIEKDEATTVSWQRTSDYLQRGGISHELWHFLWRRFGSEQMLGLWLNISPGAEYVGQDGYDKILSDFEARIDEGKMSAPEVLDQLGAIIFPPGYVTAYARVDSGEDMAETAGYILGYPMAKDLQYLRQDSVVNLKIEVMKGMLAAWSGGRMAGGYWGDLKAGLVDAGYWDNR